MEMEEVKNEVQNEVKNEIENEVEAPKTFVVKKSDWSDILSTLGEALKSWWATDKDQVLAVLGTLAKSVFNFIVNSYQKQDKK